MTSEQQVMRSFRVFYRDYAHAVSISSLQPEPLSADRLPALAERLWRSEDNFFGVVDRKDTILQSYLADDRERIVLELVYPEATGCLRLRLSLSDALERLTDLPELFDESLLVGAQYDDIEQP